MLVALLVFLFYLALGTSAVLLFWIAEIRFGNTDDLDPQSFLVRTLGRKTSHKKGGAEAGEEHGHADAGVLGLPLVREAKSSGAPLREVIREALSAQYAVRMIMVAVAEAAEETAVGLGKKPTEELVEAVRSVLRSQLEQGAKEEALRRDLPELEPPKWQTIHSNLN